MDLDAFKIICAPAWPPPPRVTSSLATKIQGKPDCLEARRLLWFLGPEVWNVVLTMTQTPTPPHPLSTRGLIQLSCCGQILSTVPYHMGRR